MNQAIKHQLKIFENKKVLMMKQIKNFWSGAWTKEIIRRGQNSSNTFSRKVLLVDMRLKTVKFLHLTTRRRLIQNLQSGQKNLDNHKSWTLKRKQPRKRGAAEHHSSQDMKRQRAGWVVLMGRGKGHGLANCLTLIYLGLLSPAGMVD